MGQTSCTLSLMLLPMLVVTGCCARAPRPTTDKPCIPRCQKTGDCTQLDAALQRTKKPLLACISRAGAAMDVGRTHRCYRALRLLESARWWLRTLEAELGVMPKVYRIPIETIRQEFFCRIERLGAARTAREVERRYLEMVQSYP